MLLSRMSVTQATRRRIHINDYTILVHFTLFTYDVKTTGIVIVIDGLDSSSWLLDKIINNKINKPEV